MSTTSNRYGAPLIALHWITLLLIAAVYALMEFKGIYPRGSAGRQAMAGWHFTLGMTVFTLTALRLLFRVLGTTPPIVPAPPRWQAMASKAVHFLLYVMLLGLPLSGWLVVSANGGHVDFWGLQLPALVAPDKALAHDVKEVHESVASFGYVLIGLHALAALYHHYVVRDNTLARMLPLARARRSS